MAHELTDKSSDSTQIIGPPAYASPDPATNAGKLVSIEEHPLTLSPDYGAGVTGETHVVTTTMSAGDSQDAEFNALPEDSADWTLDQWRVAAKHYDLLVGGNKKQVQGRVEDYQSLIEAAGDYDEEDWKGQIADADNAADLTSLQTLYGHVGADFTDVPAAFESRQAELSTNES